MTGLLFHSTWLRQNHFDRLQKEWSDEKVRQDPKFANVPLQPLRPSRSRRTQASPKLMAPEKLHVEVESA